MFNFHKFAFQAYTDHTKRVKFNHLHENLEDISSCKQAVCVKKQQYAEKSCNLTDILLCARDLHTKILHKILPNHRR